MKCNLSIFFVLFVCCAQFSFAKARIPIPYGTEEKVIRIVDLPDTDDFKLEDGTYFDIGSKYTKSHILWLSYSNTDPIVVGYANEGESYIDITEEQLAEIVKIANITTSVEPKVSFFDKILGKIILGVLALVAIYGVYSTYFGKDEEEEASSGEA